MEIKYVLHAITHVQHAMTLALAVAYLAQIPVIELLLLLRKFADVIHLFMILEFNNVNLATVLVFHVMDHLMKIV